MKLTRLMISDVRNIRQASLSNLSDINILFGENGAGKTSVLEAVHTLSTGKSFRSHKLKSLINYNATKFSVFGALNNNRGDLYSIGVERSHLAPANIRLNQNSLSSIAELAVFLPVQSIYSDTFDLLLGGPSERRRFLDWGVFHVEHAFINVWRTAQKCLKHRNALLKSGKINSDEFSIWTESYVDSCNQINDYRELYFEKFLPIFYEYIEKLGGIDDLNVSYYRGWDKEQALSEVLEQGLLREQQFGYTIAGAHKADLRFKIGKYLVADTLSRGQQKLVVTALKLAQGKLLNNLSSKQCVYLIDDLPSEFDFKHRKLFCHHLAELRAQVFITCVDPKDLKDCWPNQIQAKMFHVEHGNITTATNTEL